MSRTSKPMKAGVEVFFSSKDDANELKAVALNKSGCEADAGLWIFELTGLNVKAARERLGEIPLPPYLKREAEVSDEVNYQTTFSKGEAKAVAAPTAGLHFTPDIIEALKTKGVGVEYITLHTGPGTFLPVRVEDISTHRVPAEYYKIESSVVDVIKKTKAAGGRVIGVGTTVTRALEAAFLKDPPVLETMTDIFIYPPYDFRVVDGLLTNFHLPESSLLMLVSAFAGRERIMKAYREAVKESYRFFSYGDCMLIL
jgi:S-adenosylmethionine:tRNA ribosyltransferase-isomerase